jgi:cytochrome b6-f complex iron-sulfur subunit
VSQYDTEPAEGFGAEGTVDRRRALQLLLGGSTVGVGALLGVPVARYLRPLAPDERAAAVELPADAIAPWDGKLLVVAGRPVIVVNTGDGFSALSAVCTHLGCIVKWKKAHRQFFCPCHGGRFDVEGRVLGGPAPRPLRRFEVDEQGGRIVVRAL